MKKRLLFLLALCALGIALCVSGLAEDDVQDIAPPAPEATVGGVYVDVDDDGLILTVGGQEPADPVTVSGEGQAVTVDVDANVRYDDDAITVYAFHGSSAEVDVSGDAVSTGRSGIYASIQNDGSSARIDVSGDVKGGACDGAYIIASGSHVGEIVADTEVAVSIGGDVEGAADFDGVRVEASEGATISVEVGGDVSGGDKIDSDETVEVAGIETSAHVNSDVSLKIGGDVSGGLRVSSDNLSHTEIAILGTLSAQDAPIRLEGDVTPETLDLAVWKVQTEAEALIEGSDRFTDADIRYILRVEQPSESVGVLGMSGASGTVDVGGSTYETALAGEILTLWTDLAQAVKLLGLYNGDEPITAQNEDGKYLFTVPLGGGVSLRMDLEQDAPGEYPPLGESGKHTAKKHRKASASTVVAAAPAASVAFDSETGTLVVDLRQAESATLTRAELEEYQRQGCETVRLLAPEAEYEIALEELLDLAPEAQAFTFRADGGLYADDALAATLEP